MGTLHLVFCSLLALTSALSPAIPTCPDSRLCANPAGSSCIIRNGCRFCTCTSLPQPKVCKPACPPNRAIKCRYGNVYVNGCPICRCRQKPVKCGLPVCKKQCLFGQIIKKDRNGCDVCKCKPKCPPRPRCTLYTKCGLGYKLVDGCISPTCECNKPTCDPITCQLAKRCPLGFAQDSPVFACPTCECRRRQSPVACPSLPCLALLDCFAGSRIAVVNGCPVCQCTSAPICEPLRNCYIKCPYGQVQVNGCPICSCRPAPIKCKTLKCRRVRCLHGFAANRRGCPTCRCKRRSGFGWWRQ